MKKLLAISSLILLAGLFLHACGIIPNANTSFVTITIGDSQRAKLYAEKATTLSRFKYFLADAKLMPEAQAYIPSVVQVITVTVTAADITTPIVGVSNISSNQTTATIRMEVPNGASRQFLVEGYRGYPSGATQLFYSGTASADLTGTDVTLSVPMSVVGPGIYVNPSQPLSANTPTCGSTRATACATITYVLNTRPSTTNNDVILALTGNYIPGTVVAIESFPLQLKPGMVLLCDPNLTSVFLPNTTAIQGADGAAIDSCRIVVSLNSIGISDLLLGQTPVKIRVNGSQLELSGNLTGGSMTGIDLWSDSTVLETTVTGTGSVIGSIFGIQVWGGKPNIIGSTISKLPTGIELRASAGDVAISNSFLTGNTTVGLETVATGKPSISNTIFDGNATGIILGDGNPTITGSTFINNTGAGLDIVSGGPRITQSMITKNLNGILGGTGTTVIQNNSIYCNTFFNLSTSITATMDVRFNSWEHAPPLVNGVAAGTNCLQGDDICANGSVVPDYSSYSVAAPGICNRLLGKP
jgi:hypothetical protein